MLGRGNLKLILGRFWADNVVDGGSDVTLILESDQLFGLRVDLDGKRRGVLVDQ